MSNDKSMAEVMAELAHSIHATPNNRRRLKSATFWDELGCRKRNPKRIEEAFGLLRYHCVSVRLLKRGSMEELRDVPFGSENRDDWIVLSHQNPVVEPSAPTTNNTQQTSIYVPLDSWFEDKLQLTFHSESEVVINFLKPLFDELGYERPDFAFEHPVVMQFGRKQFTKEADVVLFKRDDHFKDTQSRQNVLVFAEAKKTGKLLDGDVAGQANSYAMRLSPVFYVLTNGDEIEVWLYKMTVADDERLMAFKRTDLKKVWKELFQRLCKKQVVEAKEKRQQIIAELQKL